MNNSVCCSNLLGKIALIFIISLAFLSAPALGHDQSTVQKLLDQFATDSQEFMNQIPPKQDIMGNTVSAPEAYFPEDVIESGQYIAIKDQLRRSLMEIESEEDGPITGSNNPALLVDNQNLTTSIDAMAAQKLTKATLKETPWTDSYWPTYQGILGYRYADRQFPITTDWQVNFSYVDTNPAHGVLGSGDANRINQLSPSEKYDLLIGDSEGILTESMWNEGRVIYERRGEVETWFGICHGWAPAAYMLPRPSKAVTLKAARHDFNITFYPSDIKALATLLWANSAPGVKHAGGRCHDKEPQRDENGRLISDLCFDTNPGAWHTAVVNQIGISKRSFIIDASYDYEVWNQPVFSYQYSYFNPQTNQTTNGLTDATIPIESFTSDKFKSYRSAKARYVVGIAMTVTYMIESVPNQNPVDVPANDTRRTVTYLYDLELDEKKNIIGGEWYQNRHPDFMWTPHPGSRAEGYADRMLADEWQIGQPLPSNWLPVAKAAARRSQPLAKVVEGLIQRAR